MKKATRKHGYQARAAVIERWLIQDTSDSIAETCAPTARLKTLVTFESESRTYLWTTDRGRSRLIKH